MFNNRQITHINDRLAWMPASPGFIEGCKVRKRKERKSPAIKRAVGLYVQKRRAWMHGTVRMKDVRQLAKDASYCCYYCGLYLGEAYHIDHYIPLSKGGLHSIENMRLSCKSCNSRKHSRLPGAALLWELASTRADGSRRV